MTIELFISIGLSVLAIVVGVWNLNRTFKKNDMDKLNEKVDKKADITYVDKQYKALEKEIGFVKESQEKTIMQIHIDLREIRSYILANKS